MEQPYLLSEFLALKTIAIRTLVAVANQQPNPEAFLGELELKIVGEISHATIDGPGAIDRTGVITRAVQVTHDVFRSIELASR